MSSQSDQSTDFTENTKFFPTADLLSFDSNLNSEADVAELAATTMILMDFDAVMSDPDLSNILVPFSTNVLLKQTIFHILLNFICFYKFSMDFDGDYILAELLDELLEILLKVVMDTTECDRKRFLKICQLLTLKALGAYSPFYVLYDESNDNFEEAKIRYSNYVSKTEKFYTNAILKFDKVAS